MRSTSLGLDLAGVEKRPTGVCLLSENLEAQTCTVYRDNELIGIALRFRPSIIGIDAPLSFPRVGGLRDCDRKLISMKIRVLPPILGGMRMLTRRAVRLKEKFEAEGFKVIECFPGAARKILELPGKTEPKEVAVKALRKLGLKIGEARLSNHELDAVLVALTARLYLEGLAEPVGGEAEGQIVIPKPEAVKWLTRKL